MVTEDTINAIERLKSIGEKIGYEVHKEYNISLDNPIIGNSYKRTDLAFFKNNELKVVIEVESKTGKEVYKNDFDKFDRLSCKCIFLTKYIAKTVTPELLYELINSKNKIEIVTKRNKNVVYNDAIHRIIRFVEETPNTYLREISRSLNLHVEIVRRCIKSLNEFIEVRGLPDIGINIQLPMFVKLKDGYTSNGIIRTLNVMKMMKSARYGEKPRKITPEMLDRLVKFHRNKGNIEQTSDQKRI